MNEFLTPISSEQLHMVDSLAEPVGRLWRNLQAEFAKKGEFYVACPLSSTPLPIYEWIIANAEDFPNWDKMRFLLMDEQLRNEGGKFSYVSIDNPASYERFARQNFLEPLQNIIPNSSKVLKPNLDNLAEFDQEIERHGGIDLLILAIGAKGHYAQVMPETSEETGFHIAKLIPEFINAHTKGNGPYQGAEFGEYGMSLGPKQVLTAKNIAVIISGEKKRELTKELLSFKDFNPSFPLSVVFHPTIKNKVQFYITRDAIN